MKRSIRRTEASPARLYPARIDRERTNRLALIRRQQADRPNAFLDTALALLLRHWASATWTKRAEILKSVDWLVRAATRSDTRVMG